jgi:hypothetical protein
VYNGFGQRHDEKYFVFSVSWILNARLLNPCAELLRRAIAYLLSGLSSRIGSAQAAWEGDLDRAKASQVLDGSELVDVTAG